MPIGGFDEPRTKRAPGVDGPAVEELGLLGLFGDGIVLASSGMNRRSASDEDTTHQLSVDEHRSWQSP